jgi:hypothetical protein
MGKAKNERTLMVYSWFALTREKQTELPLYGGCSAGTMELNDIRGEVRTV